MFFLISFLGCKQSLNMWVSNVSLKIQYNQDKFCGIIEAKVSKKGVAVAFYFIGGDERETHTTKVE